MPQTWESYIKDQDRAHTPSDFEMLKELDAYGHLNWVVGNDDWIACFDAIRHDDRIAYHVVVDCESGAFTDTLESRIVPATEAGVKDAMNLPEFWANICSEHYHGRRGFGRITWKRCRRSWQRHLRDLLNDTP
jgi:hypothetical protein